MSVRHDAKRKRRRIIAEHVRSEYDRTGRNAWEQYLERRGDVDLHLRINARGKASDRR